MKDPINKKQSSIQHCSPEKNGEQCREDADTLCLGPAISTCHVYKLLFRSYGFLQIWTWSMARLQSWTQQGQELGWGKLEAALTSRDLQQAAYHQRLPDRGFENVVSVWVLEWCLKDRMCPPNLQLPSPEKQKLHGLAWHSIPAPQSSVFLLQPPACLFAYCWKNTFRTLSLKAT